MQLTILHMLSTNSLAAFSSSVTQAGFGQVQPARAAGGQTLQTAPQTQSSAPSSSGGAQGTPSPGRIMPRGSVLDLSV
jgi:hypothetical protein